jgi:hypothetical protein
MFEPTSLRPRRVARHLAPLVAAVTAVLLALSLGAPAGTASAAVAERVAPGPIHAGNTWGWYGHGGLIYDETFVGPLAPRWKVEGRGNVQNQHGMLTLNTGRRGTVSATLERPGQPYGRWEIRLRQRQYGSGHTPYRVLTELVPVRTRPRAAASRTSPSTGSAWAATRSTTTSAPARTGSRW